MYAVAFDLVVADTTQHHPKGLAQAYMDIASILSAHDFHWVQGSLYVTDKEDMANLFRAIQALRSQPKTLQTLSGVHKSQLPPRKSAGVSF